MLLDYRYVEGGGRPLHIHTAATDDGALHPAHKHPMVVHLGVAPWRCAQHLLTMTAAIHTTKYPKWARIGANRNGLHGGRNWCRGDGVAGTIAYTKTWPDVHTVTRLRW